MAGETEVGAEIEVVVPTEAVVTRPEPTEANLRPETIMAVKETKGKEDKTDQGSPNKKTQGLEEKYW